MMIGLDASRAITQQRTGTEAYAYHLIRELIALMTEQPHEMRLYFNTPPPEALFPVSPQIQYKIMPWPRLWTHLRLGWELFQHPPDVFFTPAHVIPLLYRGCSIATVHDLGYHLFPEAHPRLDRLYLQWGTRHNAKQSRFVVADSEATKRDLSRFYAIAPQKIAVIYPGVDPLLHPMPQAADSVAAQYGLREPYLLYLSTLQPRKNLLRLLQAYVQSGVTYPLVLAGKVGWLAQPILEYRAQLPTAVQERIRLLGYIPEADKGMLLSGALAVVYPSLYEGFGFPVLEAQACGTAVLCANTSSLPEIAGQGALLVDPLDTMAIAAGIQKLCTDHAFRQTLIQAGFANVSKFTWRATAVQLLDLLTQAGTS